ncbi:MAG: hypothetical protein NT027_03175, partial [Proteobacteria bacterium]|nr:hypothetical protein [Pseudomonadota bacterium]
DVGVHFASTQFIDSKNQRRMIMKSKEKVKEPAKKPIPSPMAKTQNHSSDKSTVASKSVSANPGAKAEEEGSPVLGKTSPEHTDLKSAQDKKSTDASKIAHAIAKPQMDHKAATHRSM